MTVREYIDAVKRLARRGWVDKHLRPVFEDWGDARETGCLVTAIAATKADTKGAAELGYPGEVEAVDNSWAMAWAKAAIEAMPDVPYFGWRFTGELLDGMYKGFDGDELVDCLAYGGEPVPLKLDLPVAMYKRFGGLVGWHVGAEMRAEVLEADEREGLSKAEAIMSRRQVEELEPETVAV